jgi:hypothetical protein
MRGQHPNSRKNLKPFRPGPDPRRCTTGSRSRIENRQARLQAFWHLLDSENLSDEEKEKLELAAVQAIYDGAIKGDPILLRRLFNLLLPVRL